MALPAIPRKKPASPLWQRFAERTVEKAGVLDDDTAAILVQAFSTVPRDLFMPDGLTARAYDDDALPIGFGQTISRPSTVARMLALVGLRPGMKVLEVGCGSGYVSALMAAVGARVFAIEYVGLLAQRTRKLLDSLYFQNVIIQRGNGRKGWAEHAPYDAVVVSAAFESIEPELLAQMKNPGGRMVAPIGDEKRQVLTLWEAKGGAVKSYPLEPCNFVEGR